MWKASVGLCPRSVFAHEVFLKKKKEKKSDGLSIGQFQVNFIEMVTDNVNIAFSGIALCPYPSLICDLTGVEGEGVAREQ